MRRRSRRAPNTSESTGKIGQEVPTNQPAPLVPLYPDEFPPPRSAESREPARHPVPGRAPVPPPAPKPPAAKPLAQKPQEHAHPAHRAQTQRPAGEPVSKPADAPAPEHRHPRPQRPPRQEWVEPTGTGKLELETQPELPSIAATGADAAEKSPQAPKGYVVLAIGLPGSGKTTWFRRRGVTPLSSDLLRNILFDDVEEQRYQGLVFSTLRSLLRARLIARMPWNYVDATNLSIHERRQWIKMAQSFGYEVQGVFFDVPLDVCLERNSQRDRMVSEEVMRKMAEKLKPPAFDEGFAKITVVRVKSGS
jgi:predicted kinase